MKWVLPILLDLVSSILLEVLLVFVEPPSAAQELVDSMSLLNPNLRLNALRVVTGATETLDPPRIVIQWDMKQFIRITPTATGMKLE